MVVKAFLISMTLLTPLGHIDMANAYCSDQGGTTAVQMKQLKTILHDYDRRCGSFPTTSQGLNSLVTSPKIAPICKNYGFEGFIKKVPKDGWDEPFIYYSDGKSFKLETSNGFSISNEDEEAIFPPHIGQRHEIKVNLPDWLGKILFFVPWVVLLYSILKNKLRFTLLTIFSTLSILAIYEVTVLILWLNPIHC